MSQNNVLIIGNGGREHTLAWALARSPQVGQVYLAGGNGGTVGDPYQNIPIAPLEFDKLIDFAQTQAIALTVVGPEEPLALGIVDAFQAAGLKIFGPCGAAAQLEASKAFSKLFMTQQGIPTADYGVFDDLAAAQAFLGDFGRAAVIKADGLAAGKGVIICESTEEAETTLTNILQGGQFGEAGRRVIIEEQLFGAEFSILAFCDGQSLRPMIAACDHKRALDGDQGLNTGGMGAFAPAPDLSSEQIDQICETILQPVLDGMAAAGTPYVGVLYAGLMQTEDGLRVLEFNCRLGDPETQVILPLLETDLYEVLCACVEGRLADVPLVWRADTCALTVVLASGGYPQSYEVGLPITGTEAAAALPNVLVFHAGTHYQEGHLLTNGGRVLAVTALGDDIPSAAAQAYAAITHIEFEGAHFRRDIGKRAYQEHKS